MSNHVVPVHAENGTTVKLQCLFHSNVSIHAYSLVIPAHLHEDNATKLLLRLTPFMNITDNSVNYTLLIETQIGLDGSYECTARDSNNIMLATFFNFIVECKLLGNLSHS